MAHTLALAFEDFARSIHQIMDGGPDRTFLLMTGIVVVAIGLSIRKSYQ